MTERPRGTCTVCGRTYTLNWDGMMRWHQRWLKGAGSGYCKGSGKLPKEQVDAVRP